MAEPVTKCVADNNIVKVYELPAVDKMACVIHQG